MPLLWEGFKMGMESTATLRGGAYPPIKAKADEHSRKEIKDSAGSYLEPRRHPLSRWRGGRAVA